MKSEMVNKSPPPMDNKAPPVKRCYRNENNYRRKKTLAKANRNSFVVIMIIVLVCLMLPLSAIASDNTTVDIIVDKTSPTLNVETVAHMEGEYTKSVTVNITDITDGGNPPCGVEKIEYSLDGGATINTVTEISGSSYSFDITEPGNYELSVIAIDKAGNASGSHDKTIDPNNKFDLVIHNTDTYAVTFVDYDNTVLDTQTVLHGKSATAPTSPTREGYTFAGWDKSFDNVTSDLTIKAQYSSILTTGEIDSTSVTLIWSPVDEAAYYKIKYVNNTTGAESTISVTEPYKYSGSKITYTIDNLTPNTQYTFNIIPVYAGDIEGTPVGPIVITTGTSVESGTSNSESVTLIWSPVDGAEYYKIKYTNNSTGSNHETEVRPEYTYTSDNKITYTVENLMPDTQYTFRIIPVYAGGVEGNTSSPVVVTTGPSVEINGSDSESVTLIWSPVNGAVYYKIKYLNNDTSIEKTISVTEPYTYAGSKITYTVTGLTPNTQYTFNIIPIYAGDIEGTPSTPVVITTGTSVTGTSGGHDSATISWDPADGASDYEIRYRGGGGAWETIIVPGGGSSSYSFDGLTPDTSYEFIVTPIYGDGSKGLPSNPVIVQTEQDPGPFRITYEINPITGGSITVPSTAMTGDTMTAIATPNSNWEFVSWERDGSVVTTDPTYVFAMPAADVALKANFSTGLPRYKITYGIDPINGGSITVPSTAIAGDKITAIATPNSGYEFASWEKDGVFVTTDPTYNFTMPAANIVLVANFGTLTTPRGTVIIHYQDGEGNPIKDSYINTGATGTSSYTAPDINGYDKPLEGSVTLTITENGQIKEHTFVYNKTVYTGTVKIHYQDANGNIIKSSDVYSATGENTYYAPDIEGYTKPAVDSVTITIIAEGQVEEHTFVYGKAATMVGLNIIPSQVTIKVGETIQYEAELVYSDGSKKSVPTSNITWSVTGNASIADGLLTALSVGNAEVETTYIDAGMNLYSDNADVTIIAPAVPVGTITIKYQDVDGNTIRPSDTYNVTGENTYYAPAIGGYELIGSNSVTFVISTDKQTGEHIFVYKLKPSGDSDYDDSGDSGSDDPDLPGGNDKTDGNGKTDGNDKISENDKNNPNENNKDPNTNPAGNTPVVDTPTENTPVANNPAEDTPIENTPDWSDNNGSADTQNASKGSANRFSGNSFTDTLGNINGTQAIEVEPVKNNSDKEIKSGMVVGKIVKSDGTPVPSVKVELHSEVRTTFTDKNGEFRFRNVPLGTHKIFVIDKRIKSGKTLVSKVDVIPNTSNVTQANKTGKEVAKCVLSDNMPIADLDIRLGSDQFQETKTPIIPIVAAALAAALLIIIVPKRRRKKEEEE